MGFLALVPGWTRWLAAIAVLLAVCMAVGYSIHAYGASEYARGRSETAATELAAQTKVLAQLQARMDLVTTATNSMATLLVDRDHAQQASVAQILRAVANRPMYTIKGNKCVPSEDFKRSWNAITGAPLPVPAVH